MKANMCMKSFLLFWSCFIENIFRNNFLKKNKLVEGTFTLKKFTFDILSIKSSRFLNSIFPGAQVERYGLRNRSYKTVLV